MDTRSTIQDPLVWADLSPHSSAYSMESHFENETRAAFPPYEFTGTSWNHKCDGFPVVTTIIPVTTSRCLARMQHSGSECHIN